MLTYAFLDYNTHIQLVYPFVSIFILPEKMQRDKPLRDDVDLHYLLFAFRNLHCVGMIYAVYTISCNTSELESEGVGQMGESFTL